MSREPVEITRGVADDKGAARPAIAPCQSDIHDAQSAIDNPKSAIAPARMLNEFVYCPRLFYYEFVEGVSVHNADTLR
jgi:hypothetical protein